MIVQSEMNELIQIPWKPSTYGWIIKERKLLSMQNKCFQNKIKAQ